MTTKKQAPQFDGARLMSAFVSGASSQVELLRQVVSEGERYAKDSAFVACQALRDRLEARGIKVTNEDVATALEEGLGLQVETSKVKTFATQARARQSRRNGRNAFQVMEQVIKNAKTAVKNGEH